MKVLGSMFSMDNIALPNFLASKLFFLTNYGVQFSGFTINLSAGKDLIIWLFVGFVIILLFRNFNNISLKKLNIWNSIFVAMVLLVSIYSLGNKSEFLYLNF